MVKGISRQVILVQAPEPKLFEQAIFILRDEVLGDGITEEALLKEAQQLIRHPVRGEKRRRQIIGSAFWACAGALVTGAVWLITVLL